MTIDSFLLNSNFEEIKSSSKADERGGRLTIGAVAKKKNYRIMMNESGQIVLDPIVSIPEREIWLWKNQSARESVMQGLKEANTEATKDLGSFAEYADLDVDD